MIKSTINLEKMIKSQENKFQFQHLSQVEVLIINNNLKIRKLK